MSKNKKIAITGAGGLIGNYLYNTYKKSGYDVIGIDNFSNSFRNKKDKIIEADCKDLQSMNNIFDGVDTVFHCACLPYEGLSNFSPVQIGENVYKGTASVATAAVNNDVKTIWNFSSMARYGRQTCPDDGFQEDVHMTQPCDPYGVAKVSAENLLNVMSEIYNFNVGHIVPHNVFGENVRWNDMRRGVINIFIVQVLTGKKITIHNTGEQKRSFSFVEDTFSISEKLLNFEPHKDVFNVGPDGNCWTINKLANFILDELNVKDKKKHIEYIEKINDVEIAHCSSDKVRSTFKWKSNVCIEDEIRKMISYAKENLDEISRVEKLDISIEIPKFCPEKWI